MAGQGLAEAATDDGSRGAERRCLATGQVLPKAALVRFVVGPDGALVVDVEERLPGRGLWVKADRAALEKAAAKRLFGRSARQMVIVPGDLPAQVVARLERRCLDLLGLARRAGLAVAGFEKVRDWIRSGRAVRRRACRWRRRSTPAAWVRYSAAITRFTWPWRPVDRPIVWPSSWHA